MNETTFEKIAQYLDGELSPEERAKFESEIEHK
jgi:anti-sigma factor RsiW